MHFADVNLIGVKVIDPTPHSDDRGRFMRAWCTREFTQHDIEFLPVHANMGFSRQKGTIRGMHFQEAPALEAKLVVFAHLLSKPILAIAHHPKVTNLMNALGLSKYCLDIRTFDPRSLADTFECLVNERDEVKSRMASTLKNCKSRLRVQFDELWQARVVDSFSAVRAR